MTNAPSWYVVESHEGKAAHAYLKLAMADVKCWMPMVTRRDPNRRAGKTGKPPRSDRYVPRFGRYFFVHVRLTDEVWSGIDMQPSVRGLLVANKGDRPVPVPDSYIQWLKTGIDEESQERARRATECPYCVGDLLKVVDGPFKDHEGRVSEVDSVSIVKVDLRLFGRLTPVPVEVASVVMVMPAKSRAIKTFKQAAA